MEILEQYIDYIKCKKRLSENTICSYYTDIKKYLDYLKCENIKIKDVAEYDIINFLEWLVHRNPSENFYLARLKWNKDIEFLRKYKPIEGIVRIGNIYQKKVLTQI